MRIRRSGILLRAAAALFCAALLLPAAGCAKSAPDVAEGAAKSDYPITICGVTIEHAVTSAAVYSDSLADIVLSLSTAYQVKLAARGSDCVHPDVQVLPEAGTVSAPDCDALVQQGVQLIFTETAFSDEIQQKLTKQGIQTLVLPKADSRSGLITLYAEVASALGGGKTGYEDGTRRANNLLMGLDDVQRVIPDSDSLLIAACVLDSGGTLATDQTMTGQLLSYIGAVNAAADQSGLTAEELLTAAPSVLFCPKGLKETLIADARFSQLEAVQNGKLYELPVGCLDWQGATMLNGVIRMAVALYPSLESEGLVTVEPEGDAPQTDTSHPASVNESSSYHDILTLQNRLIELGYMNPPGDGVYGYWTKACIVEFQKRAGLEQTGIADEVTVRTLYSEDAPKG